MTFPLASINALIEAHMRKTNTPGAALAILQDGEIAYEKGYGHTSVSADAVPITPDTIFRIASVTKPLTATLILRLVEEGVLELDTPIRRYIPWLRLSDEQAADVITLRMLLSHTAGLPTGGYTDLFREPHGLETYVRDLLPTVPLLLPPGTAVIYSNQGFNLAGFVAQYATNIPFADLMQKWVLKPLGLSHTFYDPLQALTYPIALPHETAADGSVRVYHRFWENTANYPSWYAMSTIHDLAQFAQLHVNGGVLAGRQWLAPSSIAEMQGDQANRYNRAGEVCGLGLFHEPYHGTVRHHHRGDFHSFYSGLLTFAPREGVAVVALANGQRISEAAQQVFDLVLFGETKSFPVPAFIAADKSVWSHYEGTYLSGFAGLLTIRVTDEGLVLDRGGTPSVLHPLRKDTYCTLDSEGHLATTIGFPVTADSPVPAILVDGSTAPRYAYHPDFEPNREAWPILVGRYGTYEITMQDDSLYYRDEESGNESKLIPLEDNRFLTQNGVVFSFVSCQGRMELAFGDAWRHIKEGAL